MCTAPVKMDKDVFDAGNIKAECGGWWGCVDLEKVRAGLQFIMRRVKVTLFVLSSAIVHSRKKSQRLQGFFLLFCSLQTNKLFSPY